MSHGTRFLLQGQRKQRLFFEKLCSCPRISSMKKKKEQTGRSALFRQEDRHMLRLFVVMALHNKNASQNLPVKMENVKTG